MKFFILTAAKNSFNLLWILLKKKIQRIWVPENLLFPQVPVLPSPQLFSTNYAKYSKIRIFDRIVVKLIERKIIYNSWFLLIKKKK